MVRFFARETSSTAFIPSVDGLRFVAIVTVLLYHIATYVGSKLYAVPAGVHVPVGPSESVFFRLGSLGFFGVQLFFAISGFILAVPFARRYLIPESTPVSLRTYFLRRATRLEPPYIINLIVLATLLFVIKHDNVTELLRHLVASIFYLHYYLYQEPSTINGVAWSLEIEVQFYLLAPLLATVFAIKSSFVRRSAIATVAVVSCLAQELAGQPLWHGFGIWNQIHFFMIGFLLADFYLTDWKGKARSTLNDLIGVAGWIGLAATLLYFVKPGSLSHGAATHLAAACCVFAAYFGAFRGRMSHWLFGQPFLFLIGGMCYTVYLWHYTIISAVGGVLQKVIHSSGNAGMDTAVYFVAMFPVIITVSAALFVAIEKPCMKKDWPQRLWATIVRKPTAAS